MCSGKRRWRRSLPASLVALAALAVAAPAWAGQIVYTHGNDLWAMNDNGTNQHLLVAGAQVGGQIGFSGSGGDLGVGVEPNGNGIAFDAAVPASDGKCSANCPGMYSLLNGKLLRLSGAPTDCSSLTLACGSEDIDPAVTSTGRVVYYNLFAESSPSCGLYYCGYNGGYTEQYYSRGLDGSDQPAVWPLPPAGMNNADTPGADPEFGGALASDPADPTKIAYTGNYVKGLDILDNKACGPTGDSNCYPLDVENSSGAYNQTGLDDSFYDSLAFSQNGSLIADIETGDNKGIWVYSSSQSYGSTGSPNPAAKYTWALTDPDNTPTAGEFDRIMNGLTFVGNNELVFGAQNNLWSIPASCWATPVGTGTPTSDCGTFPAHATQLTHDGTSSAPDTEPAWTSSAATIEPYGSHTGPGPGKFTITLKPSSNQKLAKQKGLDAGVECSQACAVAVAGAVQIKGSSKALETKTVTKALSAGRSIKVTLSFSKSNLSKIKKALAKRKKVTAVIVAEAKDAAGKTLSARKVFGVNH